MARFNIINKAEKITDYVLNATEKSPKKLRGDVIPEIRKQTLRIVEDIVRANTSQITTEQSNEESRKARLDYQKDCLSTIRVLEVFCEIAKKRNYLTTKQLDVITAETQELFDAVEKWISSDKLRK